MKQYVEKNKMSSYLGGLSNKAKHMNWWSNKIFRFLTYLLLFDLAFVFMYPFIYMIITSLKTAADLSDISIRWIPKSLHFENYKFAFESLKYQRTFLNSVFVTSLATFGHALGCSFAAYGFARFKFPFKNLLFLVVILTIIVPVQTIITPIYILFSKIGFVGAAYYPAIILPTFLGFGLKGSLFLFIFYSYFQTLPVALEEAALIDGCNSFKTFFRIIVPSSSIAFLICTVLSVVWHWNDFFEPSLYINKEKLFLLPQMLPSLFSMVKMVETATTMDMMKLKNLYNQAVLMAGATLAVSPILFLYIFVQKRFMESIERSGITGE